MDPRLMASKSGESLIGQVQREPPALGLDLHPLTPFFFVYLNVKTIRSWNADTKRQNIRRSVVKSSG